MRQVETALSGDGVANGSTAYALSRRDAVTLALVVCLPIPALAVSGLSVPLPQIVQRVAASLVPFLAGDESAQSDALSRASIRLTASESAVRTSARLPASNVIRREGSSGLVAHSAVRPAIHPAPSRAKGRTAPAAAPVATTAVPQVEQDARPPAQTATVGTSVGTASGTPSQPGGTGGTGQPVVTRQPVVVGPVAVDPVVTSGNGTTTVSTTVTAPVVGDVTVTATVPAAVPALPAAPVQDPAPAPLKSQVDAVVKTVFGGP